MSVVKKCTSCGEKLHRWNSTERVKGVCLDCIRKDLRKYDVPARICIKCGHKECDPIECPGWCDHILGERGDPILCCDGECTYDDADRKDKV